MPVKKYLRENVRRLATLLAVKPLIMIYGLQVNLCQHLLFFASTNPQYDDRLFIELQVQCMKITSSNLGRTC